MKIFKISILIFVFAFSLLDVSAQNTCPLSVFKGLDCGSFGMEVYNGGCVSNSAGQCSGGDVLSYDENFGCLCASPGVTTCSASTAINASITCVAGTIKTLDYGACSYSCVPVPVNPSAKVSVVPECTIAGKIAQWETGDIDYDGDGSICSSDVDDEFYDTSDNTKNCTDAAGWACVDNSISTTLADLTDTDFVSCGEGEVLKWDFGTNAVAGGTGADADKWRCGTDTVVDTLTALDDTNVGVCAVDQVLTWATNDNGTSSDNTDDFDEWQCSATGGVSDLAALDDTNVSICGDGDFLVYSSDWDADNADPDLDPDDDDEWRCSSVVIGDPSWEGLTTATYTGAQSGYAGADVECSDQYLGSHVCSVSELTRIMGSGIVPPVGTNNQFWVNNGAPGYIQTLSNDCEGWNSDNAGTYGSVLATHPTTNAKRFLISPCGTATKRQFSCCK